MSRKVRCTNQRRRRQKKNSNNKGMDGRIVISAKPSGRDEWAENQPEARTNQYGTLLFHSPRYFSLLTPLLNISITSNLLLLSFDEGDPEVYGENYFVGSGELHFFYDRAPGNRDHMRTDASRILSKPDFTTQNPRSL